MNSFTKYVFPAIIVLSGLAFFKWDASVFLFLYIIEGVISAFFAAVKTVFTFRLNANSKYEAFIANLTNKFLKIIVRAAGNLFYALKTLIFLLLVNGFFALVFWGLLVSSLSFSKPDFSKQLYGAFAFISIGYAIDTVIWFASRKFLTESFNKVQRDAFSRVGVLFITVIIALLVIVALQFILGPISESPILLAVILVLVRSFIQYKMDRREAEKPEEHKKDEGIKIGLRWNEMSWKRKLTNVLFILFGVGLIVFSVYSLIESVIMWKKSVTKEAVIVSVERSTAVKARNRTYYPIIEFTDESGNIVKKKSSIGSPQYYGKEGNKIEILYDSKTGKVAIKSFSGLFFPSLFSLFFFGLFVLFTGWPRIR